MTQTQKPKFILYLRCSTVEQSTDLQRRELVEQAERCGWIYEILEDKATGKNANRPALKRLMALAAQRKIDGIAVWKCDRLFRSLKHAVLTLSEWTELGIQFVALKDSIDLTTAQGRLLANLLMSFAEFEADLIKSRVTAGLAAARARGAKLGRPQVVTPHLITQVTALRAQGHSIRKICELLDRRISRTSIERILSGRLQSSSNKVGI